MVSTVARRMGVKPGVTVSQAIGLCPPLVLLEPDPVWYDEQFARLLLALSHVSPVIEPAELGRAYVGVDGLEGLYGGPERVIAEIVRAMEGADGRSGGRAVQFSDIPPDRLIAWVGGGESSRRGSPRREPNRANS